MSLYKLTYHIPTKKKIILSFRFQINANVSAIIVFTKSPNQLLGGFNIKLYNRREKVLNTLKRLEHVKCSVHSLYVFQNEHLYVSCAALHVDLTDMAKISL